MKIVVTDESQDVNKPDIELFKYSGNLLSLSYRDENDSLKYVESFLEVVLEKIKALRSLDSIRP